MPYAVTHVLVPLVILALFRDFVVKKKFSLHYILIGGIAGILPDIDVAVYYILSFFGFTMNEIHRTFSHNIFIIMLFILLGTVFYYSGDKKLGRQKIKLSMVLFVISFGIFMHLSLDFLVAGEIMPFYPLNHFKIGLNLVQLLPLAWHETIVQSLDATLLVLWLVYMEVKHKISDFV
jgi:membrane-bound metal-dependent hydrolase YbcI (DUF457 family)